MGHDDYWVALSHEGALLGGGFFLARSYVLTTTACVQGLVPGDRIDLHTSAGAVLTGMVYEVAEDVGLALVSFLPDPRVDYATPLTDHAVKGDDWRAPYRPGPVAAGLRGTVDEISPDRRIGDGRPVHVIELALDRAVHDYAGYAGGPVERRTDGKVPAVVGIVLDPALARRLRDGAENAVAAGAISSAVEVFEALSAENQLRLLLGAPPQDAGPDAESPPDEWPAPDGRTSRKYASGMSLLRGFKRAEAEGVVEAWDLAPVQLRVLHEIVDTWEEEFRD
ncbi:hypothetical protein SAMN06272735_6678 [Streptomyces sp. TLI_55]|uniref:hypothetical protein n=1 Tax=Streptomyces sp. TLI_55 TaxID=1938861 RepID=UPI000BCFCB9A|nr:hypothetical protein [Streptomyces sp. TLI_55]SNX64850.1 hypothetical protein SAMN06272735_6678 [Streptomyces sp. TLI_55]